MRRIVSACLKLALAASFAITMGLSAATPAGAFTGDQWQHIVDCAGWMFSDPARHAAECGPGHLGDITSDSKGYGFEAPKPPAPPKETCAYSTTLPLQSPNEASLLKVVNPCCPVSYQLPAPGSIRVIPVDSCCYERGAYVPGDAVGASGILLQVQSIECDAFRGQELTSPELLI